MENGFVMIDGSKIYYEQGGTGDAVIFIHADTLDSRQWIEQVTNFSQKFSVICFDIRGFGKSQIPSGAPYSFSQDLKKLMDSLSIQKAHIVGSSLGGAIAIDFALAHPENVSSLVLIDAGISGDGFSQDFVEAMHSITEFAKKEHINKAKHLWLGLNLFDYSRSLSSVWRLITSMVTDTSGYRWFGTNQPIKIDPPAVSRLSKIRVPTLVIVGEQDIPDFQRKADLLHREITNSQFIRISRAGHLPNMDNPKEFNQAVNTFLKASSHSSGLR